MKNKTMHQHRVELWIELDVEHTPSNFYQVFSYLQDNGL